MQNVSPFDNTIDVCITLYYMPHYFLIHLYYLYHSRNMLRVVDVIVVIS